MPKLCYVMLFSRKLCYVQAYVMFYSQTRTFETHETKTVSFVNEGLEKVKSHYEGQYLISQLDRYFST